MKSHLVVGTPNRAREHSAFGGRIDGPTLPAPGTRAYDALTVVKALRIALVVLGLAVAVYGVASLTGGWLGHPPIRQAWEGQEARDMAVRLLHPPGSEAPIPYFDWDSTEPDGMLVRLEMRRDGGEALGVALISTGLALATFAAWPRRSPSPPAA